MIFNILTLYLTPFEIAHGIGTEWPISNLLIGPCIAIFESLENKKHNNHNVYIITYL